MRVRCTIFLYARTEAHAAVGCFSSGQEGEYQTGEYDKHHVSHHVATPKLYDLGDANARRYVPP